MTRLLPGVAWVCLVLAVATYGSVVVRNVTDVLMGRVPAGNGSR